jgi:predicted DNA-binding antitoxin AbrB/MazE fold protein
MHGLEIEAVYERGTLKLPRELPLAEGQRITITIHPPGGIAQRAYGRLQSPLSREDLERAALDPELDILESS